MSRRHVWVNLASGIGLACKVDIEQEGGAGSPATKFDLEDTYLSNRSGHIDLSPLIQALPSALSDGLWAEIEALAKRAWDNQQETP